MQFQMKTTQNCEARFWGKEAKDTKPCNDIISILQYQCHEMLGPTRFLLGLVYFFISVKFPKAQKLNGLVTKFGTTFGHVYVSIEQKTKHMQA